MQGLLCEELQMVGVRDNFPALISGPALPADTGHAAIKQMRDGAISLSAQLRDRLTHICANALDFAALAKSSLSRVLQAVAAGAALPAVFPQGQLSHLPQT